MRGNIVKNTTCLEKMLYILKIKLHVSAFIGHLQVSTILSEESKKLSEGVLMKDICMHQS